MEELYSKSYSRLIARAKNYAKEDDLEDEEPPEKTAPPERQIINLAQETAPANNSSDWSKYFETSTYEDEPKKKVKSDQNTQPINMMDARTISFKENATKQNKVEAEPKTSVTQEPVQNPTPTPNPIMNLHGLNPNNNLLLGLLQKNTQDQLSRNLAQQVNMMNSNPMSQTQNLANLMQSQPNRMQNPSMDPLLAMVYQNKMGLNSLTANKMGAPQPNQQVNTQQQGNLNTNFPNLGNIQQLLMMGDKKLPSPGFSLNSSLIGTNLQSQANFAGNNFLKIANDSMANSQQNAALQLLQMANLAKNSADINVKHEDETKDHDKK